MSEVTQENFKGGMYDFTNPVRIGPGGWHYMHIIGKWADQYNVADNASKEDIEKAKQKRIARQAIACELIHAFCDDFKCGKCNGHCHNYTEKSNPPEKMIGVPGGMFSYSVEFRNAVNRRLGRPEFDLEIMKKIFYESTFLACDEGCGQEDKVTETSAQLPPSAVVINSIPATKAPKYNDVVELRVPAENAMNLSSKIPTVVNPLQSFYISPMSKR